MNLHAWKNSITERAVRNPQDVEAFEGMAILQVRRGDYADAIASYRRVLELNPDDHDAKVGLGRALAFGGQYDDALRDFQGFCRSVRMIPMRSKGWRATQMWAGRPAASRCPSSKISRRIILPTPNTPWAWPAWK